MTDIEVALELLKYIRMNEPVCHDMAKLLDLYRQCLETVRSAPSQQPE